MQRRIVVALVLFGVALAALFLRYLPVQYARYELGDPVEGVVTAGFYAAEADGAAILRWSQADPRLQVPLPDRRGAQQITLALRTEEADPQSLLLQLDQAGVVVTTGSALRSYHVFTPASSDRWLNLKLYLPDSAVSWQSQRGVAVDRLSVVGRGGLPALADLVALLALALLPALLMLLTMYLPFDWSVLPGALLIAAYVLLPASDRPGLLLAAPVVAPLVAGIALLPVARQHPTLTLLALLGAGLRCYGLAWGSGYVFHPEEQALMQQAAVEPLGKLSLGTARWIAALSGNRHWIEPWNLVLLGRVWSVLLGTALILVVYLLGRQLLRPRWALLATAYVAVAPALIQQSHVAASITLAALLAALLVLCSVDLVLTGRLRSSIGCGLCSGAVLALCPHGSVLLSAPIIAHLMLRPRRVPATAGAAASAAICLLALHWLGATNATFAVSTALAQNDGSAVQSIPQLSAIDAAGHALFNILLWSLGPLLMQVGVVGWGFGILQSAQERRYRAWLPLLWSMGLYFVAATLSATPVVGLTLLVPLLCLSGAFLLQSFAQRLDHPLGQRTVRLLAGTGLCLALMTSLGLINVYRAPDPRIAASRWLLANVVPGKQILHDRSLPEQLPLGATHLYPSARLADAPADDEQRRAHYVAALSRADYVVLAADRDDRPLARDPAAACYYQALFDGRLGFVPRASFAAQPGIAAWTMDDSWADPQLRRYDHPQLRIFERRSTPTPEAIDLMLHCAGV
jgi:hypothetical protein